MIDLRIINSIDDKGWDFAWRVYAESFPEFEQRRFENQVRAMEDKRYKCLTFWENEKLIGILLYWEWENYRYIEHFAISPELRGRNYGTKLLKDFCSCSQTVILEIDPPIDEVSVNRLRFYERLGFVMNEYPHIHPPYRRKYNGHSLKVLSFQSRLGVLEYSNFNIFLKNEVMKFSE